MTTGITETTLAIRYEEAGKTCSRDVKFKGNFGFKINGKTYSTRNGKVYDSNNKEVNILKLPRATAYQFIGMSCTAESARDYTFSKKDINEISAIWNNSYIDGGWTNADSRAASVIGNGAGKVSPGSTSCKNGVYKTVYESNTGNWFSKVSVWMTE